MHNYDGTFVSKPQYKSNVAFSGKGGYTAPDLELAPEKKDWWRAAKLGMFIHWGLYAVPGKGEWEYFNGKWKREDYAKLVDSFNPTTSPEAIAEEWLDTALSANARYSVMVTRHHDGFAMWPSAASYLNFNSGLLKKDYVKAFTDACRNHNVHTGLYYSPMDWRFSGYFDPDGQPESAQAMKQQCHRQIDELISRYGRIELLWFDGGWLAHKGHDSDAAWLWDPLTLCRRIREKQPDILISPRIGYIGDFQCDEGPHEITGDIIDEPWEKCMTTGDAWGYQPNAMVYAPEFIIRMLVNVICRGGNLLLNVGPDPDGHIPEKVKALFASLGEFTGANAEAIFNTRAGLWQPVEGVFGSVYNDDRAYLHILDARRFNEITLAPTDNRFVKCETLDGHALHFTQNTAGIKIALPEALVENAPLDLVLRLTAEKPLHYSGGLR